MKLKSIVGLLVGVMLLAGSVTVYAAGFMEKIGEQQKRIDNGIASGVLTRHEADVLQDNLNWIKTKLARLKADGKLTPAEQQKLDAMLERNSQMIANKKHNPIDQIYPRDFEARIAYQQERIDNGIASGSLTRHEADVVQDNLTWIKTTYSRMKADGRLNSKETQKLEAMLERNSKMIASKKQNPIGRVY